MERNSGIFLNFIKDNDLFLSIGFFWALSQNVPFGRIASGQSREGFGQNSPHLRKNTVKAQPTYLQVVRMRDGGVLAKLAQTPPLRKLSARKWAM
jgi:hypothetical protein